MTHPQVIAVMQPYFFPYIGYYQMAFSVDEFVFFDDVNFFKKGYINRNRILLHGRSHQFTIPISQASQNRKICELQYAAQWGQFLRLIKVAYCHAPFFQDAYSLIESTVINEEENVAIKNASSIMNVFHYLGITRRWSRAQALDLGKALKGESRVLEICARKNATTYRNSFGGKSLYSHDSFRSRGIELTFIHPSELSYEQRTGSFTPNLSIIDVLMFCSVEQTKHLLGQYILET